MQMLCTMRLNRKPVADLLSLSGYSVLRLSWNCSVPATSAEQSKQRLRQYACLTHGDEAYDGLGIKAICCQAPCVGVDTW